MTDFILDTISEAELTLDCAEAGEGAFMCTFVSRHGQMTRRITMKPGYGAPELGELLYYFAVRAQEADAAEDISDWAEINGKDLSAPNAVNDFNQLVTDQRDLELLLGRSAYDAMMAGLAISQAIENAMPR